MWNLRSVKKYALNLLSAAFYDNHLLLTLAEERKEKGNLFLKKLFGIKNSKLNKIKNKSLAQPKKKGSILEENDFSRFFFKRN